MEMISNEKINFNSLEEKMYKKMMELGRNLIKDELKLVDKLIKKYRDKEVVKIKDSQKHNKNETWRNRVLQKKIQIVEYHIQR